MAIKLVCFDIDGTLLTKEMENEGEYVKGIIPTSVLMELKSKGIKIALVSPSPFGPEAFRNSNHWFKRNGSNDYRWENVLDAINTFAVTRSETVYVDDLKANRNQLEDEGIKSYSPSEFMEIYSEL